jgi:hypothetical protein
MSITAARNFSDSSRVIALAWRAGFSLFANFPTRAAGLPSIKPSSTAALRTLRNAHTISRSVFLANRDTTTWSIS